jgi:phage tail sheath protein FI
MARSINSPGVQITETDLTINTQIVGGTTVYTMGYAAQGPTDEVLAITTTSDFEQIYGIPQTPAERYFYHSCKELLNSPATLLTTRLPYGSGFGDGFDNKYTGLFFPVTEQSTTIGLGVSGTGALSATELSSTSVSGFQASKPAQISFDEETYNDMLRNNISWSNTLNGTVGFTQGTNFIDAGFVILNTSQTTVNQNFEGYYIGVTDNNNFGPETDFTAVTKFYSLTGSNQFAEVPASRLGFALSGIAVTAGTGSISEIIEGIPTFNFGDEFFKDSLIVTLFKVRKSIYEPQVVVSTLIESFIGSLDPTKKTLADSGGIQRSFYLEDVINNSSKNLKILVNPKISKQTNWVNINTTEPKVSVTTTNDVKALFAAGSYLPIFDTETKYVGDTLRKIERALTLVESSETIDIDIIVDGGLSTIYANVSGDNAYDDTTNTPTVSAVKDRWSSIFTTFNTFAQNVRKDCVFISDPLRQIFVNGEDTKVMSLRNKTFTQHVYTPLKELFSIANSNYSVTYGNWVKIYDPFSDRGTWLPFSGFAAAAYARSDSNAQPWIAPAGLNRGIIPGIIDIGFNPNQKQRDFLYTISINPVVFFQSDGFVIFGQKTLQSKPSAFDRVNVRRLFLALEKAVGRSLRFFVFEPNTEFTRTRLRNSITPIFELAKNTEGLYDYLIVCDERNNSSDSIDRNELNVDIYIKPVRAAEFILVNFIATRTGQNFQELI